MPPQDKPSSSIFICYRRSDSAVYARSLDADLCLHFGAEDVFLDLGVGLGEDFVAHVEREIAACAVLLVVIGPRWLHAADATGARRLDDPRDLVRLEIEAALDRGAIVIPLFVNGARMPKTDDLPASLARLTRLNGLSLRDDRWDADVAEVVRTLKAKLRVLASKEAHAAEPVEAPPGIPGAGAPLPIPGPLPAAAPSAPALAVQPGPDEPRSARVRAGLTPVRAVLAVVLALIVLGAVLALSGDSARTVHIGALYSLSVKNADAGSQSLNGVRFAVDYLNDDSYPDLGLSLRPGGGLPRLGGAKLELEQRDVKGNACNVAARFEELEDAHVAAVLGAYESSVTQQAVVAANRLEIPVVNDTATAYGLTKPDDNRAPPQRGCDGRLHDDPTPSAWFARVGGNDHQFARLFKDFINAERRRRGVRVRRVAVLYEGRDSYGSSGEATTRRLARLLHVGGKSFASFKYSLRHPENPRARCPEQSLVNDLRSSVKRLRAFRPDVVFALSYVKDAVIAVQTMAKLHYAPPALLTFGAGYADPSFLSQVRKDNLHCGLRGADPRGIVTRSAGGWPTDDVDARAAAKLFEQRFHQKMTDTTARAFTATIALAKAIDNAGSADPAAVRRAIRALDVDGRRTMLSTDRGIKFDGAGQNTRARGVLLQVRGRRYEMKAVYPTRDATMPPAWPLRAARL